MSDELKPCPFCGGGTTQFVENGRVWSGMKYTDPISVSVQHWCDPVPGQPSRGIERVGRDKASAITLWNTRADDTLRTQLAAMTAERDELQTSMDELRKTCAEIIGADPQTWPDHGNAPLAIAACLGLRDAELQKTTAERDAALAKVAVLWGVVDDLTDKTEEVIRISDRKHDSWDAAKASIKRAYTALEETK